MIIYLVKILLLSALLYFLYWLLLRNTKSFVFNRFYLLIIVPASLIIPLISIQTEWSILAIFQTQSTEVVSETTRSVTQDISVNKSPAEKFITIAGYIYIIVVSALLLLSIIRFSKFIQYIRTAIPTQLSPIYLLENISTPFSFLNKIYLPQQQYNQRIIDDSIIEHELAHIHQNHSIDILYMELCCILLWFNPAVYFIQKAIKNNHEYLADNSVVDKYEKRSYQQLIIQWSSSTYNKKSLLASNFNFLITKKRIIMLQKKSNKYKQWILPLAALVMALATGVLFTETAQAQKTVPVKKEAAVNNKKIKTVRVRSFKSGKQTLVLEYEDGAIVKAPYTTQKEQVDANKKYNVPPPPPPPTEVKRFSPPKIVKDKKYDVPPPPPPVEEKKLAPPKVVKVNSNKKNKSNIPPPPPPKEQVKFTPPKIIRDTTVQ